ncbi:PREDICTED: CLIP-associating protein 1-like isoform X6 [Poecilia mexicana]|uniref:CLIP-associating protein 1-like isoform X6 n=1 Tax=Poecilia mexicana TaxID=48701 RepID=UPI00072EDE7E|nr:PREDICTED: CLIP-associating protein 1-like isoform X6 [Poecilia mexicana]
MLLGALPKTFQDGATKLLHSHLKNSSNSSSGVGSPSNTVGRTAPRHAPSRSSPLTSPTNCSHGGLSPSRLWGWGVDGLLPAAPPAAPLPQCVPAAPGLRALRRAFSPSVTEYDTENMNAEEIYSSLRGVTEAIQSFSYRSQEDLNESLRRDGKRDDAVGREVVAPSPGPDGRLGLDVVEGGRTALDNKTSLLNTPSPRSFSGPRSREFAPYGYGETICAYDKSALKEAVFDDDVEQFRDCRRKDSGENKTSLPKGFCPGKRSSSSSSSSCCLFPVYLLRILWLRPLPACLLFVPGYNPEGSSLWVGSVLSGRFCQVGSVLLDRSCWVGFVGSVLLDRSCRVGSVRSGRFCWVGSAGSVLLGRFCQVGLVLLGRFCQVGLVLLGQFFWVGSVRSGWFCWIGLFCSDSGTFPGSRIVLANMLTPLWFPSQSDRTIRTWWPTC